MRLPRFFLELNISVDATILLPEKITHYSKNVLRLKNNEKIILFNGKGGEYEAIIKIQKKESYAEIRSFIPREAELPGSITLVQSLTTSNKMDTIIEKAVELGVKKIIPIKTDRSIVELDEEKIDKRMQHWRKVAISASEQCGRNKILILDKPISFKKYIVSIPNHTHLFCHTRNENKLKKLLNNRKNLREISIMIGPEGGWSDSEYNEATKIHNINIVNFGRTILRTETASTVMISAITSLLEWDDY